MSSAYSRLQLNFDTKKFGSAQNLSSEAANTLELISSSSGEPLADWQKKSITSNTAGNRSNFFQNRTTPYTQSIIESASSILISANTANDFTTVAYANTLMIECSAFQSHTDNISGLTIVQDSGIPSLEAAESLGQLNMMSISKVDGQPQNTAPILGSFTSLFIQDELASAKDNLQKSAKKYADSISFEDLGEGPVYSSNLPPSEIVRIQNYLTDTQSLMYTRRTEDWNFFNKSFELSKDMSFIQQFNNMGGTMSFLVKNVVGKPELVSNINKMEANTG